MPLNLTFTESYYPEGHGGDDYEPDEGLAYNFTAFVGKKEAGWLDINVTEDTIHIRWVETNQEFRRKGVASALIHRAQERFPNRDVDTNGTTEDGIYLCDRLGVFVND